MTAFPPALSETASAVVLGSSHAGRREVASYGELRPTSDAAFRIASLTKPFTTAATVLAARESGVDLVTPVLDLLPALRTDWAADPRITLAQLLSQVSGLSGAVPGAAIAALGDGDDVLLEAARLVGRAGSAREPGQAWEYDNGNYFVAGAVLAQLTGTTYEDALGRLVLQPWGLSRTGFTAPADLVPGVDRGRTVEASVYPRGRRPSGGLCSSLSDLITFCERLMDEPSLIGEVARARTAAGDPMAYGLGWAVGPSGQLYLNGRLPGYRTAILVIPHERFVAVALTNDSGALPAAASALSALQQPLTGDDLAEAIDAFAA